MKAKLTSPFKFLDAYDLADRDVFFGREKEVDELYNLVFKTPLLLLYGLSGTGKTSLVQCGLANRFDGPDWYPFFIRRENDINQSLRTALAAPLDEKPPESIVDNVRFIYEDYLSTVYLIFDQFEELILLGRKQEKEQFLQSIKMLISAQAPCRIILVMREEFIGRLYDFEQAIPTLFDFRLRVEPMNITRVKQVIESSTKKFNIQLESPKEERLEEIIANLSGNKAAVQLPYLQIYLDTLYKDDFARTYGANKERGDDLPPLTFSKNEIATLGTIEEVLDTFLKEQEESLQEQLEIDFPGQIPTNSVRDLLDLFVSEEGTKVPISYRQEERAGQKIMYLETDDLLRPVPALNQEILTKCLLELQSRRLLRISDNTLELAHDSLAALIDENRSDDQRQINEARRRLQNSYFEFEKTGEYLSRKQLFSLESILPRLVLTPAIEQFIKDSHRVLEEKEQAERQRSERELRLTRQKLETERKAAKKQRFLSLLLAIIALLAVLAGGFARQQWKKAVSTSEQLAQEAFNRQVNQAVGLKNEGQYQEALAQLEAAYQLAPNLDPEGISRNRITWTELAELMARAEKSSKEESQLLESLNLYKEAYELSPDQLIETRITQTQKELDNRFEFYKSKAQGILEYDGCKYARAVLEKALLLKPDDSYVKTALEKCMKRSQN
ncbi:MAG: hypothetical protein DHS20C18_17180 [Saprospiraceae bacterium]|nr:MAG: hypothetical protein DHS20C18_17180 [Saprospiraceae bacterium]